MHRVWNIVKFQVKKHRRARVADAPDDVRPGGDEEFLAHLERAHDRRELLHEVQRGVHVRHVERDDDGITGKAHAEKNFRQRAVRSPQERLLLGELLFARPERDAPSVHAAELLIDLRV